MSFKDFKGNPISGTATESITGVGCGPDPTIRQRIRPLSIDNSGIAFDAIYVGAETPAPLKDASLIARIAITTLSTACSQTTRMTMIAEFQQGTFRIDFDRIFTNVDAQTGRLRRVQFGPRGELIGNFTISIGPVNVTRVP